MYAEEKTIHYLAGNARVANVIGIYRAIHEPRLGFIKRERFAASRVITRDQYWLRVVSLCAFLISWTRRDPELRLPILHSRIPSVGSEILATFAVRVCHRSYGPRIKVVRNEDFSTKPRDHSGPVCTYTTSLFIIYFRIWEFNGYTLFRKENSPCYPPSFPLVAYVGSVWSLTRPILHDSSQESVAITCHIPAIPRYHTHVKAATENRRRHTKRDSALCRNPLLSANRRSSRVLTSSPFSTPSHYYLTTPWKVGFIRCAGSLVSDQISREYCVLACGLGDFAAWGLYVSVIRKPIFNEVCSFSFFFFFSDYEERSVRQRSYLCESINHAVLMRARRVRKCSPAPIAKIARTSN